MGENHKTLLQAIIISTIVIALLWVFAFYPILNNITASFQNDPQSMAIPMNDDSFEESMLMQAIFGMTFVSVMFFLLLTIIFYFAIKYLKKRNISN